MSPIKTALLSVYHKEGIVEFAQELRGLGYDLLASRGTANALAAAGVPVQDVAEIVGPPMLGHKVVTLSREVHAGLLAGDLELEELDRLALRRIDLVCVDLYPLLAEIARPGSTLESVTEKTDIGGPTMLRSAAKGRRVVIAEPADRAEVLAWLKAGRPDEAAYLRRLAARVEALVAGYCLASARYLGAGDHDGFTGRRALTCKYGENAWQSDAALYGTGSGDPLALERFELVAGSPPSYNNLCDLDRLLQTVTHLAAAFDVNWQLLPVWAARDRVIAIGVKHGNACGAAVDEIPGVALDGMLAGNPRSIFGGVVLVSFPIDEPLAETLVAAGSDRRRLLDGVVAPAFTPGAVEILARKQGKCRLLANPALATLSHASLDAAPRFRYVRGGWLRQPNYTHVIRLDDRNLRCSGEVAPAHRVPALLAWAVGATSNSNTITLVQPHGSGHCALIGNGVGQQDRVEAAQLAVRRAWEAGHDPKGAVAYSDSFFPFPDGPKVLVDAGVILVLTSSGSVNDDAVIRTFRDAGVAVCLIPDQLGRGFFGH